MVRYEEQEWLKPAVFPEQFSVHLVFFHNKEWENSEIDKTA